MAANSLDEVYRIEEAIEGAIKRAIGSLGVSVFIQRDNAELLTPYVLFQVELGAARKQMQKDRQGKWQRCLFDAKVFAEVKTRRAANDAAHQPLVARTRRFLSGLCDEIPEAMLPHHAILYVTPGATAPNVEAEDGVDVTHLEYNVVVAIRKSAWPLVID